MQSPRLRSDYAALRVDSATGAQVMVTGETRSVLIDSELTADLVDLLDGTRTLHELTEHVSGRHSPWAVGAALRRLDALGVLTDGATAVPDRSSAAWDARAVSPDQAESWLRNGAVTVVDAGSPVAAVVATSLVTAGLSVRRINLGSLAADDMSADPHHQLVVLPNSYLDPRLAQVNRSCLEAGKPWTLARAHGLVLLLGPHFIPTETGCWECLQQRWRENEQLENYLAAAHPDRPRLDPARSALPAAAMALAGLLAAELPVLAVNGSSARITGRMVALDTRDLSTSEHVMVHQPQCPACGDPGLISRASSRVELESANRGVDRSEGSRAAGPAEMWDRLQHHVSRYLGAVTRLVPLQPDATSIHAYSACHSFAVASDPATLRLNLRGQSGGKGRTDLQARISAMGEALERYCGVWRAGHPTRRAAYQDLGSEQAVHLRELLHYSADQFEHRDELNPRLAHFHRIPAPMLDELVMDWTTGWSLTTDVARAVPSAYCWYGHPELRSLGVSSADSNGCAAGGTVAEAVLHGFCELVERDSVALWWYHRSQVPGVELDTFADPWIDELRRTFDTDHDRDLWALDLTADLGIPAYAAVSAHRNRPTEDVLVGFGADLNPSVALGRAMAEVGQFLPMVSRFENGRTRYGASNDEAVRWFTSIRVAEQPWLLPSPDVPPTGAGSHTDHSSDDMAESVAYCVKVAERAGLEVIALDQSRPDIALAVVRVIVPGLRHFWRRLGPGRLWTVPIGLGRTPVAPSEPTINPMNVFF